MTDRVRLTRDYKKLLETSRRIIDLYLNIRKTAFDAVRERKYTVDEYQPEIDLLNSGCDVLEEIGIIILRYQRLYILFDFVPTNPFADKSRLDVIKKIFSLKKKIQNFIEKIEYEEKESIYNHLYFELCKIMNFFIHIKWWKYDAPKKNTSTNKGEPTT